MSDFGDIEPEDAWDPDDAVVELVDNLARRLVLLNVLDADTTPRTVDLRHRVDELAELLEAARRRRDLNTRDHVRIRDTDADLELVYRRLDRGED